MAEDMQLQAEIDALRIVIGGILALLSTKTSIRHQGSFSSFIETSLEEYRKDETMDESVRQHVAEAVETILDSSLPPQEGT